MLGKHELGIYEKAFDNGISLAEKLRRAKDLGFDYLEISIDETDERIARLDWSKAQKKELLDAIWDTGVSIKSMCLSAHRRFPFGSRDEKIRTRAKEIMYKAIDFAVELGIRVIQLAGYDTYYEPSTDQSKQYFFDGLLDACKRAESRQVMLAMEIMDTPFYSSITKHLKYEKAFNSPWYKVYPDLGNLSAWSENDPKAELEKGIGSIVAVHLKDTLPPTADFIGQFKGVEFGSGCVDFVSRLGELERLGYSGPYMIEMWHDGISDDALKIASALDWIREQFNRSKENV
ncbi:MAG: L-ribulose-5-phosphate 3-epimerase [Clostridia bacterium]|nr:L-ribulose-5-phosphate 3-epimerase [Clostridia bacterium]